MASSIRVLSVILATASGISFGYGLAIRPDLAPQTLGAALPSPPDWATPITVSVLPEWRHSAPPPAEPVSVWNTRQDPSAFTGLMDVFVTVASNDPVACGSRRRASLILRCLDDRTSALIGHDCETPPIEQDGWPIELRLDDGPIVDARWLPDARGETFGQWTYREARTFIETLIPSETLHVRFDDIHGVTSEMSFPIWGLEEALEPLQHSCGWSERAPWLAPEPQRNSPAATSALTPTEPTEEAAGSEPSQAAGRPEEARVTTSERNDIDATAMLDQQVLHRPRRQSAALGPSPGASTGADRTTGDGTAGPPTQLSGARWLSSGSGDRTPQ
ncbi:MAG: type VI secretion system-associated protein TagO [Pseudomonadota bacterium]